MPSNSRKTLVRVLLTSLLLVGGPNVLANDLEMSRLAGEPEHASARLADELRYQRGYSNVSHQARQLSQKAGQLRDSIIRQRSGAQVSLRFNDVNRAYQRLETAYLKTLSGRDTRYQPPGLISISRLHGSLLHVGRGPYLVEQYLYDPPPRVYITPPVEVYRFERREGYGQRSWDHGSRVLERQYQRQDRYYGDSVHRRTETRRNNHYEVKPYEGNAGSYRLGRP